MKSNSPEGRVLDRRIQNTYQRLIDSLRSLMSRSAYEKISVADICTQAQVSRSSYYAHFSGKQDLFELSLKYLADELTADQDSTRSIDLSQQFAFLPGFLQHVHGHRSIYLENRFSGSSQFILINMRMVVIALATGELSASTCGKSVETHTVLFVVGGAYAVIEAWLESGCREPVQQILERLDPLVGRGLAL